MSEARCHPGAGALPTRRARDIRDSKAALGALKRRLSDVIYRALGVSDEVAEFSQPEALRLHTSAVVRHPLASVSTVAQREPKSAPSRPASAGAARLYRPASANVPSSSRGTRHCMRSYLRLRAVQSRRPSS
jgi:hypothetical protein